MKTIIKKNIKKIGTMVCAHNFERIAYYHIANKEVLCCTKCNKRKTVKL